MKSILLPCIASALLAQTPTIEQSLNFKTAAAPRISPDGRFIAYEVSETNWDENSFETQIWMVMPATGEHYQLTHAKKSSSDVHWSPDAKRLAFLSDRDGARQIYLISSAGGEATELTHVEGGVQAFEWSPDGRRIAFTSPVAESLKSVDAKSPYEVVDGEKAMIHLSLLTLDPGGDNQKLSAEPLTANSQFNVSAFRWSPDSKRIAFSAENEPGISAPDSSDVYVARLSDQTVKKVVDTLGADRNPVWSPDGKEIAYETANGREHSYVDFRVAIVPAEGGRPRILGETFDENPHLIDWGPSGIYFEATRRTTSHLYRMNPANGAIERLSSPVNLELAQASFTQDFSHAAFVCAWPNRYPEVCVSQVTGFQAQPVTSLKDQLKGFKLATRELFAWRSKDGTPIEGILIKPHDFEPARKYPLMVVIHGGPAKVDRPALAPDRTYPLELLAAKGAVILQPNYRGSAGYGERFRSLNVRNLGLGDADDVISGVDALIAKGFIDRDRVGAMGWSEGGYISAFLSTFSDRFKAVSVGAGVSDWMTYYVNTDNRPFTRDYLQATPWEDPDIYRKTSPITYINQARTPTLIQHGELDKRVPIPNAYELYRGLKDRGVPASMIVYKGFGHEIDKPKQQQMVMEHNFEWFNRWIWSEPDAVISLGGGAKD
jgi:dipeptidyl aminopeptidase/acylaminoacyl peptidase